MSVDHLGPQTLIERRRTVVRVAWVPEALATGIPVVAAISVRYLTDIGKKNAVAVKKENVSVEPRIDTLKAKPLVNAWMVRNPETFVGRRSDCVYPQAAKAQIQFGGCVAVKKHRHRDRLVP